MPVKIAARLDRRAERFKVLVAHIVVPGKTVFVRFRSVAIDIDLPGPATMADGRDGGDAGRTKAWDGAYLIQNVLIDKGPAFSRIISRPQVDVDEQNVVAVKSSVERDEFP